MAVDLTRSCPVRVVANVFDDACQPGDVQALIGDTTRELAIRCPGCGRLSSLPLDSRERSDSWMHSGDLVTGAGLTLSPSVHHTVERGGCGWHGWMRVGRWVPC